MKQTFFKFIGALNASWPFQQSNFWLVISSLVCGVTGSRILTAIGDPRHVMPGLMITLVGVIPGLASGLLVVLTQRRHKFAFWSCFFRSIGAAIACAAVFWSYQLVFTNELAGVPKGYPVFLLIISFIIGSMSGVGIWATANLILTPPSDKSDDNQGK